jgi:hypothetical protein
MRLVAAGTYSAGFDLTGAPELLPKQWGSFSQLSERPYVSWLRLRFSSSEPR